jgi:hypothetical protein
MEVKQERNSWVWWLRETDKWHGTAQNERKLENARRARRGVMRRGHKKSRTMERDSISIDHGNELVCTTICHQHVKKLICEIQSDRMTFKYSENWLSLNNWKEFCSRSGLSQHAKDRIWKYCAKQSQTGKLLRRVRDSVVVVLITFDMTSHPFHHKLHDR